MEITEVNKIIKDYKTAIAKGTVGETILRKESLLPHSKGMIKYAYFLLIEDIITKVGKLKPEQREDFVESYRLLNTFIEDFQAEKYAKNFDQWQAKKSDPFKSKKDEMLIKQYITFTTYLKGSDLFDEINYYIKELTQE